MEVKPFSDELEQWLKKNSHKTVGDLADFFGDKSFAILFLIFMFLPALPVPTGGVTHFVLLPVVMVVALEMLAGFKTVWLPKKARRIKIGSGFLHKALPFMLKQIRKLERVSRRRGVALFHSTIFKRVTGFIILILALSAFIAPPFSGLDTVPSMGAVIIALAFIIEDIYLYMVGVLLGVVGIGILSATATAITALLKYVVNIF